MNSRLFRSAVCAFWLVLAVSVAAEVIPLGSEQSDFAHQRIDFLSNYAGEQRDYQLGPYEINWLDSDLGKFKRLSLPDENQVVTFLSLQELLNAERDHRTAYLESFRGGFATTPHPDLYIFADFSLSESKANDPEYRGKKWRGLAGSVENAFLSYRSGRFHLLVGRYASFWGGYRSLLFSPNLPLDGFGYRYHWGKITLSYRLARLNSIFSEDATTFQENRYLAGHRLDWRLNDKVRLGLFETVLFGGVGRQVEFFYLNPIVSFHAAQMNENSDDNILIGFDFSYVPTPGQKLYGQLLVDDFQIENKTDGDQEPDQYGLLLGIFSGKLLSAADLRLEYTRVTNWTFNQQKPRNRYLFNLAPIGNLAGNDFDQYLLEISRWLKPSLLLTLSINHRRQGEGRIHNDWTSPWLLASESYSEEFPSGLVEKSLSLSFKASGYLNRQLFFSSEIGWQHFRNFENQPSQERDFPFVTLTLSSLFDFGFSVE
ncbi:MAG: capsule assembly Wzi family protein [bacterium]|nr:capsule assembly Wzi family protein [bacterium]